jgi:predicted ABC-type ATPase
LARGGPDPVALVKAQVKTAGMPSPGQNGSSNTETPSQRLKAESKNKKPVNPDALAKRLAEIEAMPRPNEWEIAEAQSIRKELHL